MKRKFLTANGGIAALLLIFLSFCLALGLWLTIPRFALADDNEQTEPTDKIQNEWLYTGATGWEYNSFNAEKNVFIAVPKYGTLERDVKFELYGEKEDEARFAFTTDAKGKVSNETAKKLNALDAGKYYTSVTVNIGTEYVSQPAKIEFEVSSVKNDWVVSPSLISWKWGSFDENINVITAKSVIGNENMYFRIFYANNADLDWGTGGGVEWLTFPDGTDEHTSFKLTDGAMPRYVIDKLKKLDAGTYYLVATVDKSADGNYSELSDTSPFSVLKIDNLFTNLTIEQWTWQEFDYTKNIITADVAHGIGVDGEGNTVYDSDKYDTIRNITYSVYYDGNGAYDVTVKNLSGFKIDAYGRVAGTEAREAFKNLDAGKYWLVANTNDGCVNFADAKMQIQFTVSKHTNYWTTTPSILQWTWNEFNADVNVLSGAAKYSESATVYYGVFSKATCATADEIIPLFTTDKKGKVPSEVAKTLAGLDAGTYYLKGWTADNNGNYENCTGVVPFTVQKARNGWVVTPSVLSWRYGEYDKTLNAVNGEAKFGATVSFSVYTDDKCTAAVDFGGKTSFVPDAQGAVSDEVREKLNSLNKGMYYLLATVEGSQNYYGINDGGNAEPVPFEVTELTNYWTEAPGLIGWSESHFSAFGIDDSLSGIAKQGDVRFTVKNDKGDTLFIIRTLNGKVSSVQRANGEAAKVSDLNELSVGAYELLAEVDGDENYSGLTCTAQFAVFEDSVGLSGIIAAVITFAVLDVAAAGACIALIIVRRKKVEEQLRKMIIKELHRR